MSYNNLAFDDALILNPAPRCACMLVLDASSSMGGQPISQLNCGVQRFIEEVQKDEVASCSVELGMITFGHQIEFKQPMVTVDEVTEVAPVEANGMTPMGQAVDLAINELESRKQEYQKAGVSYYQPWLILMTDGEPNDEWQAAARRLRALAENKKMVVLCVAIGDDANLEVLSQFSVLPPKKLAGLKFSEFFIWLSQSMQRVSASIPGDRVSLPPTDSWDSIDV
ncbi:glycosyl transferase family 2 [Photobacterium aquae]|uniref:Glycosyl transferase family 2 n=1 Tax=Photobacterium aquae TaxID=1195763 RepID=A0A0J1GPU2_9GAMM|nr:VWA domain-containing protein [Photobacterium aquae]KLV01449.1 glycosyl transferase family 2 [Photobacterium aquae]